MTPDRAGRGDSAFKALLESLADGVDVDWEALGAAATTDVERRRYSNLWLIARVAQLHRTLKRDDDAQDVASEDEAPAAPKYPPHG